MTPGTRLGPYEILARLGAGGMGEVYRARDTKLNRDVAIKVLPAALSNDADYMARFQREAQTLAALNHPNIAAIYGLEDHAIVMELVQGETLAERIARGALPVEEAVPIAKQIAEALEAAHEQGIVHRDLKPGNVKITPQGVAKVLDFGLAKTADAATESDASNSPTLTIRATQAGFILGTAGYMSPEQAAGKPVDRRADIWSFGVVLWEMLTGKRLFEGETISHTLAAVLTKEPDFNQVPTKVRPLLQRCLEKDPKRRLRDIGDLNLLLEGVPDANLAPRRPYIWQGAAGVLAIIALLVPFIHFRETVPALEPMRFQIYPPDQVTIGSNMSLSPDGKKLVFQGTGVDGVTRLWLRSLDSLESRSLVGTEGAYGEPFWSPDSRFIVFGAQEKLKKIAASGGPAQILCDAVFRVGGGFWTRNGTIVFGGNPNLLQVSANGGRVSPVTAAAAELHALPSLLPDGRHFVYARAFGGEEKSGVFLGDLDAKPDAQAARRLLPDEATGPLYVPGPTKDMGYVLFVRENTLMAQPFDNKKMDSAGEPIAVAEQVPNAQSHFWAVPGGALIYQAAGKQTSYLTWYDRQGKVIGKAGTDNRYNSVKLSPDGNRLAVSILGAHRASDVYIEDRERNSLARLTFGHGASDFPVWSPTGDDVAFSSRRDGSLGLFRKASNGAGSEEALSSSAKGNQYVSDWSRDGKFLMYSELDSKRRYHLWALPLTGERKPVKFLQSEFSERAAQFSPDGRWVAYESDESGKFEVYVRPFPAADSGKWMVSQGGGYQPRWRADGKELLYFTPHGTLMTSAVSASASAFKAAGPTVLFHAPILDNGVTQLGAQHQWDISPDGSKFVIITVPEQAATAPITVVLNWQAGLKK